MTDKVHSNCLIFYELNHSILCSTLTAQLENELYLGKYLKCLPQVNKVNILSHMEDKIVSVCSHRWADM